jgi:hypothetical protein
MGHLCGQQYRASLAVLGIRKHARMITPLSSFRHIPLLPFRRNILQQLTRMDSQQ